MLCIFKYLQRHLQPSCLVWIISLASIPYAHLFMAKRINFCYIIIKSLNQPLMTKTQQPYRRPALESAVNYLTALIHTLIPGQRLRLYI